MNNFTFELLTKCLINDAMVRGVEADVRGAAPAAAAPVPLEVHRPSFCSSRSGWPRAGLPGEEGAASKSNRTGFGSICLRRFANTEDSVE